VTIDDTGEWLTYVEAGKRLDISTAAAKQLSRRRGWERRTPNAYGVQAQILVPATALEKPIRSNADGVRMGDDEPDTADVAFALLARQLEREQDRVERAERLFEEERRLLEIERQSSEALRQALADAVAAERIAAGEAAALRTEADRRHSWRLVRRLCWALWKR
jgi:hypothetical protein